MLDKFLKDVKVIPKQIVDDPTPPKVIDIEKSVVFGPRPFSDYYFSCYYTNESKFMKDVFQMFSTFDNSIYLLINKHGLTFFNDAKWGKFIEFELPIESFREYRTNMDFILDIPGQHFKNIFSRFEISGRSEGFKLFIEDNRFYFTQKLTQYRKLSYSIPLQFSDEPNLRELLDIAKEFSIDFSINIRPSIFAEIISNNPSAKNSSEILFYNKDILICYIKKINKKYLYKKKTRKKKLK